MQRIFQFGTLEFGRWPFFLLENCMCVSPGTKKKTSEVTVRQGSTVRFPIGGECVTCHGSNRRNSLGRTNLTDSLGKQQLELSTRTWLGRAP